MCLSLTFSRVLLEQRNLGNLFLKSLIFLIVFFQVRLAKQWTTVPDQLKCSRGLEKSAQSSIFVQGGTSQKSTIHVASCDDDLNFIEHVQAHVTLGAAKRGDVRIYLTSPKGTKSLLIAKRPKDYSRAGFNDWPFLTVSLSIFSAEFFAIIKEYFSRFTCGRNHRLEIGPWKLSMMVDP